MHKSTYPILEFDPSKDAVINPSDIVQRMDIPEHCVITFFREVIEHYVQEGRAREVARLNMETLPIPIYEMEMDGQRICLVQGIVGAAGSAGVFEEMIALGMRKFIVCGGAGVLRKDLAVGSLIIPTSAIRDEGLSYHYFPPSREMIPDSSVNRVITDALHRMNVPYIEGKTWTTDAFFRETPSIVAHRLEEGCLCVEMEAAAFMAVAQFRGVQLGQILYGGDDVSGETWDKRQWNKQRSIRENLVELSLQICLQLTDK